MWRVRWSSGRQISGAHPRKTVFGRIRRVVWCRGSYASGMKAMTKSFDMGGAKHGPEESGRGMITPDKDRYARMPYRRTGRSGLKLPAVSLGLWQNFGGERPIETQRAIIRRAFDLGITHFDLANNYGPPYGSAEESFGHVLRSDLAGHRRCGASIRSPAGAARRWRKWRSPGRCAIPASPLRSSGPAAWLSWSKTSARSTSSNSRPRS